MAIRDANLELKAFKARELEKEALEDMRIAGHAHFKTLMC